MLVTQLTIEQMDAAHATVALTVTDAETSTPTRTFRYELTAVGGEWRVHDIETNNTPSFRKLLANGIAEQTKGGKTR
jgi:hypothetical protein